MSTHCRAGQEWQRNCRRKMSNDEILMTNQCPNDPRTKLRHSSFVIDSSFVLRHSSLSGHNLVPTAPLGINAKRRVGDWKKSRVFVLMAKFGAKQIEPSCR